MPRSPKVTGIYRFKRQKSEKKSRGEVEERELVSGHLR